ncbi:hypothetical protein [Streptomyces sp. ALB3]|uniref:hypothetical protein n=1 Tax=Streptomyces sp. ALB3 TaxID=3374278 RepID=UPI0037987B61
MRPPKVFHWIITLQGGSVGPRTFEGTVLVESEETRQEIYRRVVVSTSEESGIDEPVVAFFDLESNQL